jgi:atypical dual specificity phosphatase
MKISWIEPNLLAASGIPVKLRDVQSLSEQGIRGIITLTEQPLTTMKELPHEMMTALGITCLHLPVIDQHPPNRKQVQRAAAFIEQIGAAGHATLVHCAAGVGRTGTMLHAYYLYKGMSLDDIKIHIQRTRNMSSFIMLSETQKAFLLNFSEQNI